MASLEFGSYPEGSHTAEAVSELKIVITCLEAPEIRWDSSDDEYHYIARPLELRPEPVDITRIGKLTVEQYVQAFNTWSLMRVSRINEHEGVAIDRYVIGAGAPLMVTSSEVTPELFEMDGEEALERLNADVQLQTELSLDQSDIMDYANLANAIFDLKKGVAVSAREAFRERYRRKTEE